MDDAANRGLTRRERRRFILRGLGRAAVMTLVLVALYFLVPLDGIGRLPLSVMLIAAPLILLIVTVWQVRAILRSEQPGLRGIEALAIIAPLYLLLFAATYFLMALDDPSSFTADSITRVDALYLTVTIFSTVGFGDISAASQTARVVVTIQMILNLIVLGAGVKLLTGAVKRGRETKDSGAEPETTPT
ncbi:potassium channel family protein [Microbacterium allomyrinae]|uniref:Two pore domain potassium channel family protein n=1 Tax=Microbacterium allomyrinae TaxID=2830666 RepID=A0A9X1LSC3_9MICO|nr:potassium channel family protein [Microbacterium allomyrinae]MCC2031074.1 two pore domain potassium channel family protein [Microbacterium allomyrinae]